jgi:hypothetical protein
MALSAADCLSRPPVGSTLEAPYFGDIAFLNTWKRTDQLVADLSVPRSYYWGPHQISGLIYEEYDQGPGGRRPVQYFDKSRMELNNPCSDRAGLPRRGDPFFVTNGLLTIELVSGQMQVGNNRFANRTPADIPLASDTDDTNAPTYASFMALANTRRGDHRVSARTGTVVQRVDKLGRVTDGAATFSPYRVTYSRFVTETGHNIADKMWQFLTLRGPTLDPGSHRLDDALSDPWYYATGYPISEPYWATVKIGNVANTHVLIQLFERRVVTYVPNEPNPNFRVQMGNIGQHYVQWRYGTALPGQAVVYGTNPTGGRICRDPSDVSCHPAVVGHTPAGVAYYNNRVKANADGIINARISATGTRFRLLPRAELQLKAREDLTLAETVLLALGSAMFDHPNAQGELEVEAGNTRITAVRTGAADRMWAAQATQSITTTQFSVEQLEGGDMTIAVVQAPTPLIIDVGSTTPILPGDAAKQVLLGGPGKQEQLRISATGVITGPEALDPDTVKLWDTYAGGVSGADIDTNVPPAVLAAQACPGTPTGFGDPAFEAKWRRTDQLVACGQVARTFYWGPRVSDSLLETYKEGPGGRHLVQYFDKSRMEITNPSGDKNAPFYVTNGLLTTDLVSGSVQDGDITFRQYAPADIPLASDSDDNNAPTYSTFQKVSVNRDRVDTHQSTSRVGQPATATIDRNGTVGSDPSKSSVHGVQVSQFISETKHNIPAVFWEFLNQAGPVLDATGQIVNDSLSSPWFFDTGYPISEPYWANVKIAGKQTDVLIQLFERRVLIFEPTGPQGFQVQFGNVGRHYFQWRYPSSIPVFRLAR